MIRKVVSYAIPKCSSWAAGFFIAGALATCALAQSTTSSLQAILESGLGASAETLGDNVLTFSITRLGAGGTLSGNSVAQNFLFVGQVNFASATNVEPTAQTALVIPVWVAGEVPLLEQEVAGFVNAIQAGGLTVSALHNHLLFENPRTLYAHIEGYGEAMAVLSTVKSAMQETQNSFTAIRFSSGTALNDTTLLSVVGGRMNIVNGVVYLKVPRNERFLKSGVPVPDGIAPLSVISMDQPCPEGARVAFQLAVLPSEVGPVTQVLRAGGMKITAIHNGTTSLLPELTIIHGAGVGDSTALAVTLRNALNKTNSLGSPKAK